MLVPGRHDFLLPAGASLDKSFVWKSGSTVVNITGFTGRCQFRRTMDATPALDLTTANGGVVIDGTAGQFTLVADETMTGALFPDAEYVPTVDLGTVIKYFYDVELVDSAGKVFRLVEGEVSVMPQTTR